MPTITSTQGAETAGPNASLPFGEATQSKQLQRQAGMFAFGGQTQPGAPPDMETMQPGGGAPGGAAPGGAAPGGQPGGPAAPGPVPSPVQPDPMFGAGGAPQMDQIFTTPQWQQGPRDWREELQMYAAHPAAGPWLKAMARIATRQQPRGG